MRAFVRPGVARRLLISSVLAVAGLAASAAPTLADYPSVVMADNPDSYFRMDDAGAVMHNETANGDGAHIGEPNLQVPGALPNASPNYAVTYFANDDDRSRFQISDTGSYTDYSIEFLVWTGQAVPNNGNQWYNAAGLVDGEVSGVTSDTGAALMPDGTVGFGKGNPDTTIKSFHAVNNGSWQHVVATSTGTGTMRVYVNGELEVQTTSGPTGPRSNSNFTIGDLDTLVGPAAAIIDEVAFYRHELSQNDVIEHVQAIDDATTPPAPDGRLAFAGLAGGTGQITAPGIDCTVTGGVFPAGDCDEFYPAGTFVNFEAHPSADSRFGFWLDGIDTDSLCTTNPACGLTIQSDKTDALFAGFYLRSQPLGTEVHTTLASAADQLAGVYDDSVDPGNRGKVKTPNAPLGRPDLEFADGGGLAAVSVPEADAKLIGSDGATLIGSDGGTLQTRSPGIASLIGSDGETLIGSDGATLIGSDGGSLIGSDGATLIGSDGATLVGNGGNTRAAHAAPAAAAKPAKKYKVYAFGTYNLRGLDSTGQVQTTFTLTKKGEKLLKTLGEMNQNLPNSKEEPLKLTLVELLQPNDNRGTGGGFIQFKID
jgi:hypothetical protein